MASRSPQENKPQNTVSSVARYSRRFLLYGFAISIALHLIFGPFVQWKQVQNEEREVEKVSVTKRVTKVVTPKPTPTPPPSATPKPITQTPPPKPQPKQVRLKVEPPKTTSQSVGGATESQYNVKSGSQEGVPQGTLNTGPPAQPVAAAPTPAPTPARACANPNADAIATDKVTPDMPEIARQMGATGTAQIKVTLDENGRVTDANVYKSTNNRALDQAALQAAKQSKYAAEVRNCVKVAGSYLYTVTFENQ
jgi:periplasmic protein TonB